MRRNRGFTLIEISIVIVIIGLLIAGVIKGTSLIQSAKVSNAITLAQDISVAVNAFKQQYHMLPGDMSINSTTPEIPNVTCPSVVSLATANNGLIDKLPESQCVPEMLFKAGLAKEPAFNSYYGPVSVKAVGLTTVSGFAPSVTHVVEFANLPCEVAQEMDRRMDNDDLASGKAIASVTNCTAGTPVFYAVAL